MNAVLLGREGDGGFTVRARAALASALAEGAVAYVTCDGSREETAICTDARVTMTPTLMLGGQRIEGWGVGASGGESVREALSSARRISELLGERGATLFGRDDCAWTTRQKAVIGARGAERVR
jgi:hypothetical protein